MAGSSLNFFERFVTKIGWMHNDKLFQNAFVLGLEEKYPLVKAINSAYNTAPMWKWGLSILPLYQVITGQPPVEKLDIAQSSALTFTGLVWAYYSTLIQPQNMGSYALCACNFAMGTVNGYNVYRRIRYELDQQEKKTTSRTYKTLNYIINIINVIHL